MSPFNEADEFSPFSTRPSLRLNHDGTKIVKLQDGMQGRREKRYSFSCVASMSTMSVVIITKDLVVFVIFKIDLDCLQFVIKTKSEVLTM